MTVQWILVVLASLLALSWLGWRLVLVEQSAVGPRLVKRRRRGPRRKHLH
ncbi:MAG: hypothetical protein VXZ59_08130 [Cyanobacteriota bacterium]|nr:hypothetical protein [Cyanobacteriota bacterium]